MVSREGGRSMALHFIGFKDDRYYNAVKVFGAPDFIHRHWDVRAEQEIMPGDVAVFATKTCCDIPSVYAFNDSQHC